MYWKSYLTISEIQRIDFDFEDCDNILRIESENNISRKIEIKLFNNNFYCEAL